MDGITYQPVKRVVMEGIVYQIVPVSGLTRLRRRMLRAWRKCWRWSCRPR